MAKPWTAEICFYMYSDNHASVCLRSITNNDSLNTLLPPSIGHKGKVLLILLRGRKKAGVNILYLEQGGIYVGVVANRCHHCNGNRGIS